MNVESADDSDAPGDGELEDVDCGACWAERWEGMYLVVMIDQTRPMRADCEHRLALACRRWVVLSRGLRAVEETYVSG